MEKLLTGGRHVYVLGETIARTSNGKVKTATNQETGELLAIKSSRRDATPSSQEKFEREVRIMRILEHPNLIRFEDAFEDEQWRYIVMERGSGDLFDHLIDTGKMGEDEARGYFKQVLAAISHCHDRGIAHRDLKPENLLLSEHGTVKVCDFGLANQFSQPNQPVDEQDERLLSTVCGTERYAPPELLKDSLEPYSGVQADAWCIGVVLYVMVQGFFPFFNATAACERYADWCTGSNAIVDNLSPDLQSLLRGLLHPNPAERFSLSQAGSMRWLTPPPPYSAGKEPAAGDDDWEMVEMTPTRDLELHLMPGSRVDPMEHMCSLLTARGFVETKRVDAGGSMSLEMASEGLEVRFRCLSGGSVTVNRMRGCVLGYHQMLVSLQELVRWRQMISGDAEHSVILSNCGGWGWVELSGRSLLGLRIWRRRYAVIQGRFMFVFKYKTSGQEGVVLSVDLPTAEVELVSGGVVIKQDGKGWMLRGDTHELQYWMSALTKSQAYGNVEDSVLDDFGEPPKEDPEEAAAMLLEAIVAKSCLTESSSDLPSHRLSFS